ncbi:MAG: arylsulfatase [Akkermansiaceae bacterium]
MIESKLSAILKPCAIINGLLASLTPLYAQDAVAVEEAEPAPVVEEVKNQPNVILIMSDDQGWGDFGTHGNTVIETPHLNQLAKNSVSWENFYVSPVCSPTRASLMTGRYNQRTKSLDTYLGRSMMATDEVTVAEALKGAGYATGIFGKWHLGDNYPMRPSDQGFEYSFIHKGGGLGQPSDPIENEKRYTDPILFRNNSEVTTKGYCTDLYFDEAIKFIADSVIAQRPFFAYIATNAPHGPFGDVPQELLDYYKAKDIPSILPEALKGDAKLIDKVQRVAAMITNLDQNVGKLVNMLETNKLLENTLIIYLNDNGPNTQRFTGKFRGIKSNVHEGGVRSPLWMHWPAKFKSSKVITSNLAAHIDIMPTIMDACELGVPDAFAFDGRSLLDKSIDASTDLAPRPIIIQAHRGASLDRYHNFMIRDKQWKLSNDSGFSNTRLEEEKPFELYDLLKDPGETTNLATEYPDEVKRLTDLYDAWYDDVTLTRIRDKGIPDIIVDKEQENPLVLTWQERISQNWGTEFDGFWKLFFPTKTRADVIIYAAPESRMKDPKLTGFTPVLQIGTEIYKGKTLSDERTSLFEGINIPKGKLNVQAMFISQDETQESHAYQIRIIHR